MNPPATEIRIPAPEPLAEVTGSISDFKTFSQQMEAAAAETPESLPAPLTRVTKAVIHSEHCKMMEIFENAYRASLDPDLKNELRAEIDVLSSLYEKYLLQISLLKNVAEQYREQILSLKTLRRNGYRTAKGVKKNKKVI
ncbi:hypothetical protein MHJ94_11455 [Chryseobacterium taklimakanense]|uniref:hypothetical protein n=1 Tax=Chryseobacterium taklimakanense TaxID=536441 RepID=UPI001EF656C2|nr:hypothetical protein [Chryseobacterium taklimakanense]MCG7281906.1 hypothetical protein [Chryseobacterium taklimakanense]